MAHGGAKGAAGRAEPFKGSESRLILTVIKIVTLIVIGIEANRQLAKVPSGSITI